MKYFIEAISGSICLIIGTIIVTLILALLFFPAALAIPAEKVSIESESYTFESESYTFDGEMAQYSERITASEGNEYFLFETVDSEEYVNFLEDFDTVNFEIVHTVILPNDSAIYDKKFIITFKKVHIT